MSSIKEFITGKYNHFQNRQEVVFKLARGFDNHDESPEKFIKDIVDDILDIDEVQDRIKERFTDNVETERKYNNLVEGILNIENLGDCIKLVAGLKQEKKK